MQLIDDARGLDEAIEDLSTGKTFFIDTEFESTKAGTTLCLIQVSAGREIYLVDALRLRDLTSLGDVVAARRATWVLHAGVQDVPLLCRAFDLESPPDIFDTQIAWGLMSAEASVSLAYLQYKLLKLRSMKTHQADDWKRRPLPRAQQAYAASDVEHLPELYDQLMDQAEALDRVDVIFDATDDALDPQPDPPTPLNLDSFRNAWQLDTPSQAVLRALIEWFNERQLDPKAVPSKAFLAIASRVPRSVSDLSRIKAVPHRVAKLHGQELVALIKRAAADADGRDFVEIEPSAYATFGEVRADGWFAMMRAEVCAELQVAPELALPGRLTRLMRRGYQQRNRLGDALEMLSGWRADLLSKTIERFAERVPPPSAV